MTHKLATSSQRVPSALQFGHERYADDVEELEGMTQDVLVKTLKSISTLFAR